MLFSIAAPEAEQRRRQEEQRLSGVVAQQQQAPPRQRRHRTIFSEQQLAHLEAAFARTHYPGRGAAGTASAARSPAGGASGGDMFDRVARGARVADERTPVAGVVQEPPGQVAKTAAAATAAPPVAGSRRRGAAAVLRQRGASGRCAARCTIPLRWCCLVDSSVRCSRRVAVLREK
ncbi:hypothetical protein MRX96_025197 [Rhipicephalus microplus]